MTRRIKLGVVANEFFDLALGGRGGFGWATRQLARCFADPSLGVDVVYLTRKALRAPPEQRETVVHGRRLLLRQRSALANFRQLRAERPDLLLCIDFRPEYRQICWTLPRTPMIVWVLNPLTPDDVAQVNTLRIPGAPDLSPQGTFPRSCSSLAGVLRASRWLGRPVLLASPAPYLRGKLAGALGMDVQELFKLPNPIGLEPGRVRKNEHPRVLFLGRLDPIKRPWLFADLARAFPSVEFLFAGQAHHRGEGAWEPGALPPNVRLLGHIDGPEKLRVLASAWVLVNTSIYEGLAISFLEGLACETPILACVDPSGIVSKFGLFAGRFDGNGLEALPSLAVGLQRLLSDVELRARLGAAGRQWVEETHSPERFLEAFRDLCARAGVLRTAARREAASCVLGQRSETLAIERGEGNGC